MRNIIFSGFREREVEEVLEEPARFFPGNASARMLCPGERIFVFRDSPSVFHVRIVPAGTAVSPRIPPGNADLIFSREPWDALRVLFYLRKDGTVYSGDSGGVSRGAAESVPVRRDLDREAGCDRKKCWEFLRRRVGKLEVAESGNVI